MASDRRDIQVELHLDAHPDVVWEALTDPVELTRWFPLDARVQPGEGGAIDVAWGEEIRGRHRILTWEPGRRLRTTWFEPTEAFGPGPSPREGTWEQVAGEDQETARRLVVDYQLEGRSGGTALRLVHSGFSRDARWDYEYDGHRRGWSFEILSLKNYLEHHRGKDRHLAWVRRTISGTKEEAWSALTGPAGLCREGTIAGAAPGSRYAFTTVHGDRLEGTVRHHEPPDEFAATVDNLDHSLLRAGIEAYTGPVQASFWLSTWGSPDRARQFTARWTETMATLFPG